MDVRKALSELYLERQQLEEAIISLEHLVKLSCKRRGLSRLGCGAGPADPSRRRLVPPLKDLRLYKSRAYPLIRGDHQKRAKPVTTLRITSPLADAIGRKARNR